jgi:crotonobetainyl-CoA:carnitine CoA-transferase CaiB-like acyl-CoA transferase
MGWVVSNYLVGGVPPLPMGDQNATAAPSGTFEASDGPLNIAANRQEQFEKLCRIVDRVDLLTDSRFTDRDRRKLHREELNRELNNALRSRPAAEWEQLLGSAGVPAARILTVAQMVELDQLTHRQFFADVPFPGEPPDTSHRVRLSGSGVLIDGQPLKPSEPAPLLGEHDPELEQILRRWQLSQSAVPNSPAPTALPDREQASR